MSTSESSRGLMLQVVRLLPTPEQANPLGLPCLLFVCVCVPWKAQLDEKDPRVPGLCVLVTPQPPWGHPQGVTQGPTAAG